MKHLLRANLSVLFSIFLISSHAQEDLATAGGYLQHFSTALQTMNQTYLNYMSAVSHGKSARKVEKLRNKTVDVILNTRGEISTTPGFKGDKTYRDASSEYVKICYAVFNEDYKKIVNMEEVAEQSYDAMEAYLLAQKLAGEKLKEAGDKQQAALAAFASKNNITLTNDKNVLDIKLEQVEKVNDYYTKVYLIFFKSYKQDMYLTDAVNRMDLNGIEQARNALENYATQGLEELNGIGAFQTDASLTAACRQALVFYKNMATKRMEPVSNFVLVSDNFKKAKKTFDALPQAKRTQADVDNFNKIVNEVNKSSKNFNQTNTEINKERNNVINGWNDTAKNFFDSHMPYAK